jgi:hypothetical protein
MSEVNAPKRSLQKSVWVRRIPGRANDRTLQTVSTAVKSAKEKEKASHEL